MNNTVRIALAAVAVVVVALLGYQLFASPNAGGPGPLETPTPSPEPTPSTSPLTPGSLEPRTTYRIANAGGGIALTIAVPVSGWAANEFFQLIGHPGSEDEAEIWLSGGEFTPGVFADPCAHEDLQEYAATVVGYTEGFASIPGTELLNDPVDVTVDARVARTAAIAIPEDVGCENGQFWLLFDATCPSVVMNCTTFPTWLGETITSWFVDVDGSVFEIRAEVRHPDRSAVLEEEIQQIVDSIQFE